MPCKNLDKALLFLRNQVFCLKIWKYWRTPTILQFNIFCWNFAHVFYLPMSKTGRVGFSFILLRSWNICNNKKRPGFYTLIFCTFFNNSRSNQNKKYLTHSFVDITKWKTCAKFQQKILKFMVTGAHQSFQLFRQSTWSLGNNIGLA